MKPATCPNNQVFVGAWHQSDLSGAIWVRAEIATPYTDRRSLERQGWVLQKPDALRGAPFSRALHPKAATIKDPAVYLVNHSGRSQRIDGPVVQVVYVPVGNDDHTFVDSWASDLQRWYHDDSDLAGRFCCGVLFIKSDA